MLTFAPQHSTTNFPPMSDDSIRQRHRAFWPKGQPFEITPPEVPLTHFLKTAAERFPRKPAIVFGGAALSYGELWRQAEALAGHLAARCGVAHGDRVLLMGQNCPQYVTAYYGILRAGAVVVPVNAMTTSAELAYYVANSGARTIVLAQELLPQVLPRFAAGGDEALHHGIVFAYSDALQGVAEADVWPHLPPVVTAPREALSDAGLSAWVDVIAEGLPAPAFERLAVDDLAVLPYTSGTTGHPKGCMHTHRSLLAAGVGATYWRGLHAESVFLAVAPLFHGLGMQNGMNIPIVSGATVVMMPRWHADLAGLVMERYRVSVWTAPPAMVIDFFAHPANQTRDISSLAVLSGGGAAMPEAVAAMLKEKFDIAFNEAYGLTESAAFLHANPVARGKKQCLGIPTYGVDSRVVDPGTLEELPPGEVGELVTSGAQIMQGYWRNDAANAASYFERDGKRFFRTGDLVSVDEEGYFFMRDRLKRMINVSGYKVWPAEVESMLYEHPAVHEACVIALPDAKAGEMVKALLVLKPEAVGQVTPEEIIAWSRERMAVYKAPRQVDFIAELPKSGTGKIMWRELQEQERSKLAAGVD
jgi:fatty-acyl-CoA synthase